MGRMLTLEEFVDRGNIKHSSKYDYSISVYLGSHDYVSIICPIHGEFQQVASEHLRGHGCKDCQYNVKRSNISDVVGRFNMVHNNRYDYSKVKYVNNGSKVEIICLDHGSFFQTPSNHIAGNGCPKCSKSSGEMVVESFLIKNGIDFDVQKWYDDLRSDSNRPLRFDFYFKDLNLIIEYDGRQHYEHVPSFQSKDEYDRLQYHDSLKNIYCNDNDIALVRIRYDDDIIAKLQEIFYEG